MNPADLLRPALANGPLERAGAPFRLIEVRGQDAAEFLHRLCTQDVVGLADGSVGAAAFLDNKGKLLATCLVFRAAGSCWLEVTAEQAERLAALLERYHFTERLTITLGPLQPVHETVGWGRGGGVAGTAHADERGCIVVSVQRRGFSFVRRHGGAGEGAPPRDGGDSRPGGAAALDDELAACVRLAAGFVHVGLDTEPATLGLEADLDDHISTTKGCYTGQEIVARIHTYGHTNRKLCLLHLAPGQPIAVPEPLHEPDDRVAVGRVMRAIPIPGREGRLGTGYLPKDFQALGTRLVLADGGMVEVIGYEPLAGLPA